MVETMKENNYFALLGLPCEFTLDEEALQQAYIRKQRQFHPDRVMRASPQERAAAMQMSVEVNMAYSTLKEPLLRAEYVLKLAGINESKPSQSLLMESMEAREELMEADSEEALMALEMRQRTALKGAFADFSTLYTAKELNHAAECAMRLRYLSKLLEEIRARQKLMAARKKANETPANT